MYPEGVHGHFREKSTFVKKARRPPPFAPALASQSIVPQVGPHLQSRDVVERAGSPM